MNERNRKQVLLIVCPPVWEKLPPLGVALLCEFLKQNKINCILYDLNIRLYHKMPQYIKKDWTINKNYIEEYFFEFCFKNFSCYFNEILKIIRNNKIKFVGFSVLKSNRKFCIKTVEFVKKHFKNIKIIFGGPEVFNMSLENFSDVSNVDYFIVGEGEKAILQVLKNNKNQKVLKFLQLEEINFFPKYNEFNLSLYTRKNSLPLITSRGCINNCKFCSERLLFKGFRIRDPKNIFEEISFHYRKNNVKWFTFYDSIFNADLKNIETLMDLILKSSIKIVWDAQIAIRNDMTLSILEKMKRAGCINLFVGLESGSERILKLMNKNFKIDDAINFFEKLNRADLQFEISLIVNYPGETEEDFNETLNFIKNNRNLIKKIAQINTFIKYPGTSVNIPDDYNEKIGLTKISKLLKVINSFKIKYTKSFINNLI